MKPGDLVKVFTAFVEEHNRRTVLGVIVSIEPPDETWGFPSYSILFEGKVDRFYPHEFEVVK